MASTDARPVPIKNTAYRLTFGIRNVTGDLVTGAAALDSEVSKDNGTFADCTNEATEVATASGVYYLDLTSTEMNADSVAVIVKTTTTDAKTFSITIYPQESGDINVNVQSFTAGSIAAAAFAANAIVAATLAADVITAAKVASDVGTEIAAAVGAGTVDGAITRDKIIKMLLAFMEGKAAIVDNLDGTSTITYGDQADADVFNIVSDNTDGSRTTNGTIS